jgi:hypothetical protein
MVDVVLPLVRHVRAKDGNFKYWPHQLIFAVARQSQKWLCLYF